MNLPAPRTSAPCLASPVAASRGPRPLTTPRPPLRPSWSPPAKYQVRRVIGSGGMGTVLLARDRGLDRLVAIKVLLTDCAVLLGRLQHEARLLARLDHPAIVRVHELDVFAGRLYLAMEYAAGGSLATAHLAPVPPVRLVRLLRGVVDALGHAHARGVVHRDVKPENVLLRAAGGPALLGDFGLACSGPGQGTEAMRRPIVGTPLTMSPEQVDGRPVGPESDVFSLGVTLYRALSGRWPFPGRDVHDVFEAIRQRPAAPLGASVPRRLRAVIERTLHKDPERRFASMAELGAELDRFARGRILLPFFPRRAPRAATPIRLHPEDLA